MAFGKKVAVFDWEWGRNSVPRKGQKMPWLRLQKVIVGAYTHGVCLFEGLWSLEYCLKNLFKHFEFH